MTLDEYERTQAEATEAIDAAQLAEAETAYRLQLAREMYQAGRRDAEAEMAEAWRRAAAAVNGPQLAEVEQRRWGPGGRAHFADPRPGDFPGLKKEETERERELEALDGRSC
jgi:hypothetical protein